MKILLLEFNIVIYHAASENRHVLSHEEIETLFPAEKELRISSLSR
jgi:hypothetical protein